MADIRFPFGRADVRALSNTADATALTVSVTNGGLTYVKLNNAITANLTVTFDVDPEIGAGALLFIEVAASGANRTLSFGTSTATAVSQTITASQSNVLEFVHNGSKFIMCGNQRIV